MTRIARFTHAACVVSLLALASMASAEGGQTQASKPAAKAAATSNEHIEVQHILIGYQGSVPGKNIQRSPRAAQRLAETLVKQIKGGANFDSLVKKHTDDAYPGVYRLAAEGVAPGQGEYARGSMVKGFGDTAFSLKVGEVGLCRFDKAASPFGFHIIKRLK